MWVGSSFQNLTPWVEKCHFVTPVEPQSLNWAGQVG